MDSSVTEHYLDYDSDQFDSWLKDFDTLKDSSEEEAYTDASVSSVVNKRTKKNSIFVKPVSRRSKRRSKKLETTIEYSESVIKPKVTRPCSRKVPLFFFKKKKTTKFTLEKQENKKKVPKTQLKVVKRQVKKKYQNKINWDKININDLNLILPNI